MAVSKAVVRGLLIAALMGQTARAGSMLVLGMTPDDNSPSSAPQASTNSPLALGVFSASGGPVGSPSPPAPSSWWQPAPQPAPAPTYQAPSPAPSPAPAHAPASSPASYDAVINMGPGPFPGANALTTGNPQPWYLSRAVDQLYGGVPNAQQQSAFESTVLQRIQQTFGLSGVPVSLTDNTNVPAAHSLSVVSQATNPTLPGAIGMTSLGGSGFHFIDNAALSAQNIDQLEWIVAHNVAHELMLAFGVPEVNDTTGNYIDARDANLSMMLNPNATFSQGAVNDLLAQNFQNTTPAALGLEAQLLLGSPSVPEPATVGLWGLLASISMVARRRRA